MFEIDGGVLEDMEVALHPEGVDRNPRQGAPKPTR